MQIRSLVDGSAFCWHVFCSRNSELRSGIQDIVPWNDQVLEATHFFFVPFLIFDLLQTISRSSLRKWWEHLRTGRKRHHWISHYDSGRFGKLWSPTCSHQKHVPGVACGSTPSEVWPCTHGSLEQGHPSSGVELGKRHCLAHQGLAICMCSLELSFWRFWNQNCPEKIWKHDWKTRIWNVKPRTHITAHCWSWALASLMAQHTAVSSQPVMILAAGWSPQHRQAVESVLIFIFHCPLDIS